MPTTRKVYQFKIILQDTAPPIWRWIQVPEKYTFWDLHVAIQDSMGWFDCHLHAFRFGNSKNKFTKLEIGIPDDVGLGDIKILPGWEVPIREYFDVGKTCLYEYDFGDGWTHELILEGIMLKLSLIILTSAGITRFQTGYNMALKFAPVAARPPPDRQKRHPDCSRNLAATFVDRLTRCYALK